MEMNTGRLKGNIFHVTLFYFSFFKLSWRITRATDHVYSSENSCGCYSSCCSRDVRNTRSKLWVAKRKGQHVWVWLGLNQHYWINTYECNQHPHVALIFRNLRGKWLGNCFEASFLRANRVLQHYRSMWDSKTQSEFLMHSTAWSLPESHTRH